MSLHQPHYIIEDVNIKPLPNRIPAHAVAEMSVGRVLKTTRGSEHLELNETSINISLSVSHHSVARCLCDVENAT